MPQRVHEALIRNTHRDRLVGHLSRDSTAIEAREKPAAKEKAPSPPKRKRGRPKKGEERPKVLKRLDRQAAMTLPAMLDEADRKTWVAAPGRRRASRPPFRWRSDPIGMPGMPLLR